MERVRSFSRRHSRCPGCPAFDKPRAVSFRDGNAFRAPCVPLSEAASPADVKVKVAVAVARVLTWQEPALVVGHAHRVRSAALISELGLLRLDDLVMAALWARPLPDVYSVIHAPTP
jgi:hypothetical protein